MIEIWKDIKDFKGIYQVSNLGRVKSLERKISYLYNNSIRVRTQPEKILSNKSNQEYIMVSLIENLRKKQVYVHRLVAEHFIENKDNKTHINHKDWNKHNNNVENLEWVTCKENLNHREPKK